MPNLLRRLAALGLTALAASSTYSAPPLPSPPRASAPINWEGAPRHAPAPLQSPRALQGGMPDASTTRAAQMVSVPLSSSAVTAPRAAAPMTQGAEAVPRNLPGADASGSNLPAQPALGAAVEPTSTGSQSPINRALTRDPKLSGSCANLQAEAPQVRKVSGGQGLEAFYRGVLRLSPPALPEGKSDIVAPGQSLIVTGHCFGAEPGQVNVVLQARERPPGHSTLAVGQPAPVIVTTVQKWTDGYIELLVPSDVRGVPPGPAALQVVRADGRSSAAQAVSFYPLWEVGPLAAAFQVLACAEPHATAASRCDVLERPMFKGKRLQERGDNNLSILGRHEHTQLRAIHFQDGDWPALDASKADGVDTFGFRLPAWTAAWVSQDPAQVDVRFWSGDMQQGRPEEMGMRELLVRPAQGERRWSAPADHVVDVPWRAPGVGRWRMYELKIMAIWPYGMGSKPGDLLTQRATVGMSQRQATNAPQPNRTAPVLVPPAPAGPALPTAPVAPTTLPRRW